jgi:hypothetical protein
MLLHAYSDRLLVTEGDERFDERVRASVGEVLIRESEPPEVLEVVRRVEVLVDRSPRAAPPVLGFSTRRTA